MRRLGRPGPWFAIAAVGFILVVFFIDGAAGGVVAGLTCSALLVGCFRSLALKRADGRVADAGLFGHWF